MRTQQCGQLVYLQFETLAGFPDLVCAVSTRLGGVSEGHWRWTNLSFRVGDDPTAVAANRERLCRALGQLPAQMVAAQQVHGVHVARVGADDKGRGAFSWETALPATDALIADRPGLILAILVADCAPVVLYDPVQRAIGLAHAGWRGAIGRIARQTALAMAEAFGTRPADLWVGIGPSIGPCCYEVGPAVVDPLRHSFPYWQELLASGPTDRPHFDLPGCLERQLIDLGVPPTQIELSGLCTSCRTDLFYSHRAGHGQTGRFAALVGLQ